MTNQQFFASELQKNRDKWLCADSWLAEEREKSTYKGPTEYIFQVRNTSDQARLFYIGASIRSRFENNYDQPSGVTISSTIVGTTYDEFLAQTEAQPFIVKKTMVITTSLSQINNPSRITHRNANGDQQIFVLSETVDPYQKLSGRLIDETEYIFDGFTALGGTVNAATTVTYRLYISDKFAPTQIVAGRNPNQKFMPPHIVKVAPQSI